MGGKLVVVSGVCGTRKHAMTIHLAEALGGWRRVTSTSSLGNPYWPDLDQHAFQSQTWILSQRIRAMIEAREALAQGQNLVICGAVEEVALYSNALAQAGLLAARDLVQLGELTEILTANLPSPDLLIYLHRAQGPLTHRVFPSDLLRSLGAEFIAWIESYGRGGNPTVTVPAFNHRRAIPKTEWCGCLEIVVGDVRARLGLKEEGRNGQ